MARTLSFLVCAFACGIVLERALGYVSSLGVYLVSAAVLFSCLVCVRTSWIARGNSHVFAFCALLLIVTLGAVTSRLERYVPASHIANFYLDQADLSMYTLEGTVADIGTPANRQCLIKLSRISSGQVVHPCSGFITVTPVPDIPLSCGQRVAVQGEVRRHYSYARRFGVSRQARFTVSSRPPGGLRSLACAPWHSVSRARGAIKWKISRIIQTYLPGLTAKILGALLLGERAAFPAFVNVSLMRTGTIHIISVSGFHVGLIAYLLHETLKIFRVPRRSRLCVIIPLLIFYCALTGSSSPVERSTIMGSMFLAAYSLRKEPDTLHALSVAGLCLLALSPGDLFTVSFQLSFASVLSIVLFYPRFMSALPGQWISTRAGRMLASTLMVSLSAWLGTAAIVAAIFKIVTPVALIANLVVVPLSALLMCAGIVFVACGFFMPGAAAVCALTVQAATALLLHSNAFFSHLPGAYFYIP